MAITTNATLDDSQVVIYDEAVYVSGANLASLDEDGSVTLGGMINGGSNEFPIYTKLSPVTAALTDGTDVTPVSMADSKVTITPKEYGNVVTTTRLAGAATDGRADMGAAKLIGINKVESPNARGVAVLEAATNSTAAGTAGTLAKADVRAAVTKLESAGALPFADGQYRIRIHPNQLSDIKDDIISIMQYTNADGALRAEIGSFEGCRIIKDRAVTDGTVIVYGDNALGKSESVATDSTIVEGTDRLGRERNYGWYGIYDFGIVDQNSVQLITGA